MSEAGAAHRYRPKPVTVEAIQWTGKNTDQVREWTGYRARDVAILWEVPSLAIHTIHGVVRANPGDYILQGGHGEYIRMKPETFHARYEPTDPNHEGHSETRREALGAS